MPNQRDKNKAKVNVWLSNEEKEALQKAAKAKGMTVTEFIKWVAGISGLILIGFHLWRSPLDWSLKSIRKTGIMIARAF
jgi:Protein of unknown function (DUF1778)